MPGIAGQAAVPVCETADLAVTLHWEPDGSGLRGQVVAENVGNRACRLPGKPTVAPLGLDGEPPPAKTVVTLEMMEPGYVVLSPGGRGSGAGAMAQLVRAAGLRPGAGQVGRRLGHRPGARARAARL